MFPTKSHYIPFLSCNMNEYNNYHSMNIASLNKTWWLSTHGARNKLKFGGGENCAYQFKN